MIHKFSMLIERQFYQQLSLLVIVFIVTLPQVVAQDIQYSQFYANVLYLNPAFAGSAHTTRGIFHQRVQWPSLDAKYTTSHFSIDHYNSKTNSGFGLMFFKDWQGTNNVTTTELAAQYAYELHLTSRFSFRAGMQASYVSRNIDYSQLRFPDQYSQGGYLGAATNQPMNTDMIQYVDLTSGGILYTEKYWFGITYAHMNRPNQSFVGDDIQLPYRLSYTGGYKFILKKGRTNIYSPVHNIYLTPTVHYKLQGKSDQIDLGTYFTYDYLISGIWYRGIPLAKRYRPGLHNNESIIAVIGLKISPNLSVSYSYDFVVSKLTVANTGGAHEINITYTHNQNNKKKGFLKKLPCPDFEHHQKSASSSIRK